MPDTTAYNLSRTGTISSLFFKNLWVLFSAIFVVSLIGTLFTTYLFMKSTAVESTRFLADDLTSQLNTVYSLLEGMSEQPLIKDTSISVQERAASMKTYADAFGFWMIGVVDPDGTISSTLRPKTGKVQRGYIPRIMASGKREISDPFPAGATGDMTYSQFMPIKKDGKVVSICFVTTPLSLLSERVTRRDHTGNGYYLMLSSTGSLIAHPNPAMSLTHIRDHVAGERFLYGSSRETFLRDIKSDQPGTFISIFRNTLYFTAFMNIPETGWTLIHRVKILPTVKYMLLAFFTQTLLYTLLFVVLYRYGRTAISQELRPVDNILRQVEELNRSVNAADSITEEDVFNIINISRKGLYDALTGLPTRNLFRQRVNDTIEKMPGRLFGVFILDPQRIHGTPLRAGLPLRGRRIRPVHPARHTFRCFRPSPGTPRNPAREHRRERCGLCLRYEHRGQFLPAFRHIRRSPPHGGHGFVLLQTERQGNIHLPSLPCGMPLIPSLAGIAAFPSRKASCTAS